MAGAIGYMFFALVGFPSFASSIAFTPVNALTIEYTLDAIALGIIGALVALFIGISFQGVGKATDRVFKDRFVARVMVAGANTRSSVIFFLSYCSPAEPRSTRDHCQPGSIWRLDATAFAILKVLLLLRSSFKSGYLGGPIFPTLFASTMLALAISLIFPGVPIALLFTCIVAATIALVLGALPAAILLTIVISPANTYELGYISLATATALVIGAAVRQRIAQRHGCGGSAELGSNWTPSHRTTRAGRAGLSTFSKTTVRVVCMICRGRSLRVAGELILYGGGHIVSYRGVSMNLQCLIDSFPRLAKKARGTVWHA